MTYKFTDKDVYNFLQTADFVHEEMITECGFPPIKAANTFKEANMLLSMGYVEVGEINPQLDGKERHLKLYLPKGYKIVKEV